MARWHTLRRLLIIPNASRPIREKIDFDDLPMRDMTQPFRHSADDSTQSAEPKLWNELLEEPQSPLIAKYPNVTEMNIGETLME